MKKKTDIPRPDPILSFINPSTGAGAYMISGSFNGGFIGFDSTNDCEKSYLENAINNFVITNNVIPGILAPPGLAMLFGLPEVLSISV